MILFLQAIDTGNASTTIAGAADNIDTLLLALVGALLGMVAIIWIATKAAGSVLHMLAGIPWFSKLDVGGELHSRANAAIFRLLIEAPLIVFGALLIGHIVQQITGFSIPITFPNLKNLGGQ